MPAEPHVRVKEAARHLGHQADTPRRAVQVEELPTHKVGHTTRGRPHLDDSRRREGNR
jgi:hypothetical protein